MLLMDEPFGALDAMTRDLLHEVLEGIWRRRKLSVLFVTHEVREAVRLGDRVVLLEQPAGPGHRRVRRSTSTGPAGWTRPTPSSWLSRSRPSCGRRSSAMAVETPQEPGAALAGLDQLDQAPPQQAKRHLAEKAWAAAWPKLLALVLALAIWQLVYLSGFKRAILPGPATTLANLWGQLHHALLWQAIGTTLRRAVIGFAIALVIGTVVGALVSRIRPLRAAVGSLITAVQTLPSIVWVPFAIILFGANTTAILFVIVMTAAPAIANGLIAGADYLPPLLLRAGKTMGLRRLSLYRYVIMPATLPAFVGGLKQGWAFGWHGLIAGEVVVIILGQPSLGVLLSSDQDQADMASAIAVILVILVIGIVVDMLFNVVNTRIRRRCGVAESAS